MTAVLPDDMPPPLAATERTFQRVLSAALASLGFFLLWSTAGISLSLAVLLGLCLAAPHRIWALRPWRDPVLAIGLVLLAYIALRTFAGEGLNGGSVGALNRYHELLMLPILWALFRIARRPQAFINGLMAGALLMAALYWLPPFDHRLEMFLHLRRISAGFGLAVCAFLFFEHARLGRMPRAAGYGAALFLSATLLFASDGRTGHLVLLVLIVCAAFRAAPTRWGVPMAVGIFVAAMLVAGTSEKVRSRVGETVASLRADASPSPQPTSTAVRLVLLRNGVAVARDHWLAGTGWQHYQQAFDAAAAASGDTSISADNPHNEYLLQLGAGGLPALLLFLAWLIVPMWHALRERRAEHPWAGAVGCVALAFAISAVFNSVLLDFVEGHFYGALLAWLLVRRVPD